MPPEIKAVEEAMKGFRDCGLLWPDVAMLLENCAKLALPNEALAEMFFLAAQYCGQLSETVQSEQLVFHWAIKP